MNSGHFHPFVSRRVTAIVLMHCGAKTNHIRNASAVGSVQHGAQYRLAEAFATRSLPCADGEEVEVAFGRMIFLHDLAGLQRPFHSPF